MSDWRAEAACRTVPTDVFFPVIRRGAKSTIDAQYRAAREVCARCPVQTECLSTALELGEHKAQGIWAGKSEAERRRIRRRRAQAAAK